MDETKRIGFWEKKTFVSYILCVLVLCIHVSTFYNYPFSNTPISEINQFAEFFIRRFLTPVAVPLFFILSGFSFFRNYDNAKYLGKIKSRSKTLLIPYLFWNSFWTVFYIVISFTPLTKYFIGRQPFELTVKNVLQAVFLYKTNGPFWFIFCLIVFSVSAPVIALLIKNKYIGIVSIILLIALTTFGIALPENIFFRYDALIYYLLGGFFSYHYKEYMTEKTNKPKLPIYAILLLLCLIVNGIIYNKSIELPKPLNVLLLIVLSLSFWKSADLFIDRISIKPFMKQSFMVYAIHTNIVSIITKLIFLLLPKSEYFAIPNALCTIVITLGMIHLLCYVLEKYLPSLYNIVSGTRK